MTPETESIERRRLPPGPAAWQQKWYEVIFEADTTAGKAFDVALLLAIVVSILVVMLESVGPLAAKYGQAFDIIEWVITLLFTLEFLARLACVARPSKYALSFFGVVDLVSLLPSYLSIIFVGADSLLIIRTLRLLRIFRVLKLARHVSESRALLLALRHTWPKITVFLLVIFCAILISGTAMYLIERGPESDFENIPISVYWAIVTMTTVGYGDIAPKTELGRFLAALIMLFGYAVIIVPTGIFSAEVMTSNRGRRKACGVCGADELSPHANFCEHCGAQV